MFFVIADDTVLEVLPDIAAVRRECEPIDVQNGVYSFFDQHGRRLIPRFTQPVETNSSLFGLWGSVGGGSFELDSDPLDDGSTFEAMLASAAALGPNPWFASIDEVARSVRDSR
jgi:hypothetical protein